MSQYKKIQQAAALKYSMESSQNAPVVVASGLGTAAQKIIEIAQENNIPVYQDDSLAAILSQFYAGAEIPVELYQTIADIYIYFLNYNLHNESENRTSPEDSYFTGTFFN